MIQEYEKLFKRGRRGWVFIVGGMKVLGSREMCGINCEKFVEKVGKYLGIDFSYFRIVIMVNFNFRYYLFLFLRIFKLFERN